MSTINHLQASHRATEQDRAEFTEALREMGTAGYVVIDETNPVDFIGLGGISSHHETPAN